MIAHLRRIWRCLSNWRAWRRARAASKLAHTAYYDGDHDSFVWLNRYQSELWDKVTPTPNPTKPEPEPAT